MTASVRLESLPEYARAKAGGAVPSSLRVSVLPGCRVPVIAAEGWKPCSRAECERFLRLVLGIAAIQGCDRNAIMDAARRSMRSPLCSEAAGLAASAGLGTAAVLQHGREKGAAGTPGAERQGKGGKLFMIPVPGDSSRCLVGTEAELLKVESFVRRRLPGMYAAWKQRACLLNAEPRRELSRERPLPGEKR